MRTRNVVLLATGVVVLIGILIALPLFLPERAMHVQEDLDRLGAPDDLTIHATGTFEDGEPGHRVRGTIQVVEVNGTHHLRFIDYEQTQGPDVFVYLTEATRWDRDTVESGLLVRIDGGADGGESTKTGTFHQALPSDFDPTRYRGVAIWCDRFDVLFGSAVLTTPA